MWEYVDDGWFKQPCLAESDWTLGLGEAAHLLHIELSDHLHTLTHAKSTTICTASCSGVPN